MKGREGEGKKGRKGWKEGEKERDREIGGRRERKRQAPI